MVKKVTELPCREALCPFSAEVLSFHVSGSYTSNSQSYKLTVLEINKIALTFLQPLLQSLVAVSA